jgi:hypothetical protein
MTKIYFLSSLIDQNKPRYIGKIICDLNKRLKGHLFDVNTKKLKNHLCCWLKSLLKNKIFPSIILIGEVEGDGCKEEIAWIKYGKEEGWNLTNTTDGGEGGAPFRGHHHSLQTRKKMSLHNAWKGKHSNRFGAKCSNETKKRISLVTSGKNNGMCGVHRYGKNAPMFGKKHSIESRKKMSEHNFWRGKHIPDKIKRIISLAQKGKHVSLETRLKMSISRKAYFSRIKNEEKVIE